MFVKPTADLHQGAEEMHCLGRTSVRGSQTLNLVARSDPLMILLLWFLESIEVHEIGNAINVFPSVGELERCLGLLLTRWNEGFRRR